MKYLVLIIDGAAGWPLPDRDGRTCLELARTPNLDRLTRQGTMGLARTVPEGMEPSSACACMSILGYDPRKYYSGRAAIEARGMGIPLEDGEVVFRCNLVSIRDGRMWDYSSGHISTEEARPLMAALNGELGNEAVRFYTGTSYRHLCKLKGQPQAIMAACTPPHDIPNQPIDSYLPRGEGSRFLKDLMRRSEDVLRQHPVNTARAAHGEKPATMVWLFWGSEPAPEVPPLEQIYGVRAAMTSGVDLLSGLARMLGMAVLDIPGVTDGLDNDYAAQAAGALEALDSYDLVVVHVEAPDEAAHGGSIEDKVTALQRVDEEVIKRLAEREDLRLLVMPDHPTPIEKRTHTDEPVPFLLWGPGFNGNGGSRFTELEAEKRGLFVDPGYNIMSRLLGDGEAK